MKRFQLTNIMFGCFSAVILITLILPAHYNAEAASGFYLGLGGGYSQTYGSMSGVLKGGRGHTATIGYRLNSFWAVEGGLSSVRYPTENYPGRRIDDATQNLVFFDFKMYPFNLENKLFNPFLLGGWGYGHLFTNYTANVEVTLKKSDARFNLYPFFAGTGVNLRFGPRFFVSVDARYEYNLWEGSSEDFPSPYGNTFFLSGALILYLSCQN
jgi:hypothetical protein